MKKFFVISAAIAAMLCFVSCSCQNNNVTSLIWNVTAEVQGEGKVVVGFPTGNFTASGNAMISAMSAYGEEPVPANAPELSAILACPADYSEEEVAFANKLESAFHVDVLEGTWKAVFKGYAKYGNIYIVIDEEFPKPEPDPVDPVDSTAVDFD